MAHILQPKTRAEATPREWLLFGAQLAAFVNERSDRSDIIAFVGQGAGHTAPACFIPAAAEIELNLQIAFVENVKPAWVGDFTERKTLFDWPKAAGAVLHEASHARWSTWDVDRHYKLKHDPDLYTRKWAYVLETMEETRIEALAVKRWPDDRAFLRTCAIGLIVDDIDVDKIKEGSLYSLSCLALLTLARRDGKVLEPADVQELDDLCRSLFGDPLYEDLQGIWLEVNRLDDPDPERVWDRLVELAKEWVDLIQEKTGDESGEDEDQQSGESGEGPGMGGSGEMELTEEQQAMLEAIEEMLAEAQASAEIGGADDAADQEKQERWTEQVMSQNAQSREAQEHRKVSDRVFGKSTADIPDRSTQSRIIETRNPTPTEHAAAVLLAQELEKARYRDRIETETPSMIPPGRLRARDAVLGDAQRATGQVVTAQPWRQVHRKHTEDPELKIGVMVDISGSMNSAMKPMATTAWVLAEAGYRINAQVAQVYYGNSAFPTLKPGQRLPKVVVRSAADGTERFNEAFKALDGKLELLNGTGARLLVICSDTVYTYAEVEALEKWLPRCIAAGVGVICMTYGSAEHLRDHNIPKQIQIISQRLGPVEAAKAIGQAAVKALAVASAGR
jgi:hypothetical protein